MSTTAERERLERQRAMAAVYNATRHFETYAETFLRIRLKVADEHNAMIAPLRFNAAQRILHAEAERQLAERGFVRIIGLKARQQGFSTYVEARGYWRVATRSGMHAFVMTHLQDSTDALFGMVSRFHQHMPPAIKAHTKLDNANELYFDRLDSRIGVATAGSKGIGRGHTTQFFHGSEVAYWANAADHATGILETVPMDGPGTEVFLESTANGIGNWFCSQWGLAVKGETPFKPVFVPWFVDPTYRTPVRGSLDLTGDEEEYQRLHGLDLDQMQWRADKIAGFEAGGEGDALIRFMRDYPGTPDEAFAVSDGESLIKGAWVLRARRNTLDMPFKDEVWGCDPSDGGDRFPVMARSGRRARRVVLFRNVKALPCAHKIAALILEQQPVAFYIDAVGIGAVIYQILSGMDLGRTRVVPVMGGETADDDERFFNKRSECWGRMRDWLREAPYPDIPDDDELHADLTTPRLAPDTRERVKLERKDQMKKRGAPSPDLGDALAYTFAYLSTPRGRDLDPNRPAQW